ANSGYQAVSPAFAVSGPNPATYTAAPAETHPRASVVTAYAGGSTVIDHPLYATTIGIQTSYNVFLPPGYDESTRRYPVLYMLHGVAGDATEWQSIGLLEAADRMTPDGEIQPM